MIDDIIIGFLGAALGQRLLQVFRPKKRSIFDSMTFDELQVRNRWIEYGGLTVTLATLILAWGLMVAVGLQHNLGGWVLCLVCHTQRCSRSSLLPPCPAAFGGSASIGDSMS
jgi:hypothetical protein